MLIGIFYSQVVESSSLVPVLFREAISHPYISFFHLLVNVFSVTSLYTFVTYARKIEQSGEISYSRSVKFSWILGFVVIYVFFICGRVGSKIHPSCTCRAMAFEV